MNSNRISQILPERWRSSKRKAPDDENARIVYYLQGCSQGDRSHFENLYRLTSPKLFGLLLRILKNQAESEDCLQQVYIKIWSHADRFQPEKANAMTWLATIARNQALDQLRKNRKLAGQESGDVLDALEGNETPHEVVLEKQQSGNRVHACIDTLPDNYRQSVELAYFEGLTHPLLAERMQVPLGTVKTWVRRGLLRLKECMTQSI